MSHVFHQLYYHFAWATHFREPLIDRAWRPQLLEIINDEVKIDKRNIIGGENYRTFLRRLKRMMMIG